MGQGCWWRLFGRCTVLLNWRTKTNRQYTIVAPANRSDRGYIITANCTLISYWRWTIWTIWHSKSMTICVASNESISQHGRWHIFVRGQGIGRGRRLSPPTGKWTNNGNYQSIRRRCKFNTPIPSWGVFHILISNTRHSLHISIVHYLYLHFL